MRLICPNCQQSVTLPDSDAGQSVECPQCHKAFNAPQMYVAPPAEPPINSPPAPPAVVVETRARPDPVATPTANAAHVSEAGIPVGYGKFYSFALSRPACEWLVPICLTLAFFLTFFRWAGFFPAGYAAYTQSAWQALFASMSVDPVAEKLFGKERELNNALAPSWWMLPYLLLLIVGVALAWADHLTTAFSLKLPGSLQRHWNCRPAALAFCGILTLFFLLIQCGTGFGLEKARARQIEEAVKEQRADARTPEEIQKVEMRVAVEVGSFNPENTVWLRLVIGCHFLAVVGIAGQMLLSRHGNRPPPRIGVMW